MPTQTISADAKAAPERRPHSGSARLNGASGRWKSPTVLGLLLTCFMVLQCFLPLRTTVQIGADEGFELAKATLCLKGYELYTEAWNDQPPLHTFLVTQILKHLSPSILGPRLLTIGFAGVLLAALFLLILRVNGLLAAGVAAALLIASPGFLELSSSCMLEIPSLATALAGLCVLVTAPETKWRLRELLCGLLFAAALQMKLVPAILLSATVVIIVLEHRNKIAPARAILVSLGVLGFALVVGYVTLDLFIERGAYLVHFRQAWASHFGRAQSFEYGSANDYPFQWTVLLKNWDMVLPGCLGALLLVRGLRRAPVWSLPVCWLAICFAVFASHKPWWPYYYIHTAIPLCWCAGVFVQSLCGWLGSRRLIFSLLFAAYALASLSWMGTRLYLQIRAIRNSPQTYYSLVLNELQRFKPFTRWLYADAPIYSFHSGIPMPPQLAVVPFKRFWSGEITNAGLVAELERCRPGLILLNNDTREVPFQALLNSDYQVVYRDARHRLYAHRSISKQVD